MRLCEYVTDVGNWISTYRVQKWEPDDLIAVTVNRLLPVNVLRRLYLHYVIFSRVVILSYTNIPYMELTYILDFHLF